MPTDAYMEAHGHLIKNEKKNFKTYASSTHNITVHLYALG